jgi:hypothetical protein
MYESEPAIPSPVADSPAGVLPGSRGIGGFGELMLGGAARWAANRAPCPVLVARSPTSTR